MEDSGSTTIATGWQPHHLIMRNNHQVVAIFPLFIKHHSYGEYVFDWSWADAYHRHGVEYYPKLVNAIPFTPAGGPRWGIRLEYNVRLVLEQFTTTINDELKKIQGSSCHCLFTMVSQAQHLEQHAWMLRSGYQYHWFNNNYDDFNDFLAAMSSRKRKNILKERRKINDQNITLSVKVGSEIDDQDWQSFYLFYQVTYLKRSGRKGYLSPSFFPLLAKTMGEHLVMIQAFHHQELVASALCFKDSNTLYGRYWGCKKDFDSLHFETCYYQGIEYAIKHRLKRFDPGAQGEHKIQRGFKPIKTYSHHWISHPTFREAIKNFLTMEDKEVDRYLIESSQGLPFKQ
jgi:predicted N-acyltransferase